MSAPHLVHLFSSFGPGGAQLRTAALINRFGCRYRHTIAALDRRTGARDLIDPGLDVGVIGPPEPGWPAPVRFGRMHAWLRMLQPDLVLTYGWPALELALAGPWRPRAPVMHLPDDGVAAGPAARRLRPGWRARVALARVDRVVVAGRALERIARRLWRIPEASLCRIPNGIELDRFGRPPERNALPDFTRQPGEAIAGTVCTMRAAKGLDRLVRVFAKVADARSARLVIVGDGPERGDLIGAIVEHGLEGRVALPGYVPRPERYLGWFDVFALASESEQMPHSLMEAMAQGLPVVATDVGDIKAMVSEPNRDFVVDRANEAAFAAKLDALLRDGQLRMRLGRANRDKALAEFGFERTALGYARLFEELLALQPAGHSHLGASA